MKTYNSIQENIKDIIPIYIQNNKDTLDSTATEKLNLLANIRIYGSPENPKYHLKDVAHLLNISNFIEKTDDFDDEERELAYIVDNQTNIRRKIYLLTDEGLQRFIYQSNTPVGKLFRKCIKFIIDELLSKKIVTLTEVAQNVENNHIELYKQAAIMFQKNINKLKEKNNQLQSRIEYLSQSEEKLMAHEEKMKYELDCIINKMVSTQHKYKLLANDFEKLEMEANGDINYIQLQKYKDLQKKYTKQIYIYLEPIPYDLIRKKLKNKNLKESAITAMLGINAYDINAIYPQQDENMLFNIYSKAMDKRKKTNKVLSYVLHGSSDAVYEALHKKIYDTNGPYIHEIFQPENSVLLCTINDIIDEFNNILIQLHKENTSTS